MTALARSVAATYPMTPNDPMALAHWRQTIAELYAGVRKAGAEELACDWAAFRAARDALFRTHPQSPLSPAVRASFGGLDYFPYDSGWRLTGRLETDVERVTETVDLPGDGPLRFTRVARLHFTHADQTGQLNVFWIEGYGGGLFLPFADATSLTAETYGGGRYLYDTIKGADLGVDGSSLVLDFNYAYNPSCAYDDRWVCPLAPAENRLPFPVRAGERAFAGSKELGA